MLVQDDGVLHKKTRPERAQDMLVRNAEERGMVINDSKTGLMCMSAARSFSPRASLVGRGDEKIEGMYQFPYA